MRFVFTSLILLLVAKTSANTVPVLVNSTQPLIDFVEEIPNPNITRLSPNTNVCLGNPIVLEVEVTGNGTVTYLWKKDNIDVSDGVRIKGSSSNKLQITSSTTSDAGKYTCQITDADGTVTTSEIEVVVTEPASKPNVTSPVNYCLNETPIALEASGTNLKWYTAAAGGTFSEVAPVPSTDFAGTNFYYVTQTIDGCESERSAIEVITSQLPNVTITGDLTICKGEETTLTASGADFYNWGEGFVTTNSKIVSPNATTTYSVTGKGADGCEKTTSFTVNVVDKPTVTISAPSAVTCSGNTVTFSLSGTPEANVGYTINSGALKNKTLDNTGKASIVVSNATTNVIVSLVSVNNTVCNNLEVATTVTAQVKAAPNAPEVTTPLIYCLNDNSSTLTAGLDTGNSLKWYNETKALLPSAPTPNTSVSGTFSYFVSQVSANGCESELSEIVVIVNSAPSAPVVSNNILNYCQFDAPTPLSFPSLNNPKIYDALTGGNFLGTFYVPETSSIGTFNFYVSETINGCEGPRAQVTVTVKSIPAAPSVIANIFYCKGDTPDPLSAVTAVSGTLKWYATPTGGTASTTPPIVNTNVIGTTYYYVSETSNFGCESARSKITVNVNDIPNTPSVFSVTQPTCTLATGSVTLNNLPSGNWTLTNLANNNKYSNSGTTFTINGLLPGSYSFKVSNAICDSELTTPITINNIPTQSAPIIGAIVQPAGTTTTGSVKLSGLPTSGSWTLTNTANGSTITNSGGNFTINNLSEGTYNYTVTSAEGCISNPSLNIVIDAPIPTPDAPIAATNQNFIITQNPTVADLTIAGSGTPVWYNFSSGGTSYSASQPLVDGTTYYAAQVVNGVESINRTPVSVTISPISAGGVLTGGGTVCFDSAYTLTLSSFTGAINYWESSPVADFATGNTVIANSSNTLTVSEAKTSLYYRAFVKSGSAPGKFSSSAFVAVVPLSKGGEITPTVSSICKNELGGILTLSNEVGNVLKWQKSEDSGVNWTDVSNTNTTLTLPNLSLTTSYRAVVQNGSCAIDTSNPVTITVNNTPSITDIPNTIVCLGDSLTLGQDPVAGHSYSWYSNLEADPTLAISGRVSSKEVFTFNTVTTQTITYRITNDATGCFVEDSFTVVTKPLPEAKVIADSEICEGESIAIGKSSVLGNSYLWSSVPAGFTSTVSNPTVTPLVTTTYTLVETTPNGCSTTNEVTITVQPKPVISILGAPEVTMCEKDTDIQLQATVSNYTANSYEWSNITGEGAFDDVNAKNPTYRPSANDINRGFVIVQLSVTGSGDCSQKYSEEVLITIDKAPIANAGSTVTTCGTNSVVLDATATLNATSLVWEKPFGVTGTLDTTDPYKPVFTPSATDVAIGGTLTFKLNAISGNSCSTDTANVEVIITPPPVVEIAPNTATICETENYIFSSTDITVNNTNNTTYSWSKGTGDGKFTDTSTLVPTYIPGPNDIANGTVTLTLSASGNSPCSIPGNDSLILNIEKKPVVNAGPDNLVCNSGAIIVSGASIQNAGNILWKSSGSGFFEDATLENPRYIPSTTDLNSTLTFTVEVTPTSGCSLAKVTDTVLYTINAAPTVDAIGNATICETTTNYQLKATVTNSSEILWTTSNGTGTFDNNSVNEPIYTPSLGDIAQGSVTFKVTVSNDGCADVSDVTVLTIQKSPTANAGMDKQICQGESVSINGTVSNASSYKWSHSGLGSLVDDETLTPTYISSPTESGKVILTLRANAKSPCGSFVDSQMSIFITAEPSVNAGTDATICENDSFTVSSANSLNTSGIQWSSDGDGTFQTGSDTTLTPTYIPGTNDKNVGKVILTMTGIKNAPCNMDAKDAMELTINKIPTINVITPNVDLCVDTATFQIADIVIDHYDTLLWETSGTGNFGGLEATPKPIYYPTPADYEQGAVTLTLTASRNPLNCNTSASATIVLNFKEKPIVDAGPISAEVCEGFSYNTKALASESNTAVLSWSSDGTGTWSSPTPNSLDETYTPSSADFDRGFVNLTLQGKAMAPCTDIVTDVIRLDLQKMPVITVPTAAEVCATENSYAIGGVSISPATAFDATSVKWETSGTGTFSPSGDALNPIYNPSSADIAAGNVTLSISVDPLVPCATTVTESFVLNITPKPIVNAGISLTECDVPFQITTASFTNTTVDRIEWTNGTSDGTFDADNIIDPIYTPGSADLAAGFVELTLTGYAKGSCTENMISKTTITFVSSPKVTVVTPQNIICENDVNVTILGTSVTDEKSLLWTSNTGTSIGNPTTLSPLITPSAADISNGFVELTLTATPNSPCGKDVTETVRIPIQKSPVIDPGASQEICEGAVIVTSDATASNVTNLVWSNNGGDGKFTTSITNPVAEYQPGPTEIANGIVELVLTADAVSPCVGTISKSVNHSITKNPIVTFTENEQTICASEPSFTVPASFVTVTNLSSVATYSWSTSGNVANLTGANTLTPTYAPTLADIAAGFVNLTLTVNPKSPCSNQLVKTLKLNIAPKATISFTDDGFFCEGTPKTLSAEFQNHDASTIRWSIVSGTGTLSGANTETAVYTPAADSETVTLKISVQGNGVCNEVIEKEFTMATVKTPVVTMSTTETTVCSTQATYNLTGNSTVNPLDTVLWTKVSPVETGNFSDPRVLNPSYTFSAADISNGFVILRLTATSAAPCEKTDYEEIKITIDKAPTATITSPAIVCEGEPYIATVSNPDGNIISWTEVNGNHGSFVSGSSDTATFNQLSGNKENFEIQLTSTSTNNCATKVETIIVQVVPKPTITIQNNSQQNCSTETFTISGVTVNNAASIIWTVDGSGSSDGFSNPTEENPTFTPTPAQLTAGQVVLRVTANAVPTCGSSFDVSDTITLNFDPAHEVSFTAPSSICENDSISLVGLAPNSSSISWSSSSTTATIGFSKPTDLNSTYTPSALDISLGKVTLTLTGISNTNCPVATSSVEVLIEKQPIANAGAPVTICENTPEYQVNDASASNYDVSDANAINWTIIGNATIKAGTENTLNPIVVPNANSSGILLLTLQVNGFSSCNTVVTDTKEIKVAASPVVAIPVTKTICEGESLTLSNSEVSVSNAANILWSSSNGLGTFTPSNTAATIYTPDEGQTGLVDLIIKVNEGNGVCATVSKAMQLNIVPKPTVNAGTGGTICVTDTFTVSDASLANYSNYTWSISGPAKIISGANSLTPVIASDAGATGTAIVTLTAFGNSPCGLTVSDSFNIAINPAPQVDAGLDAILCEGTASYQLEGTSIQGDSSTTYSWSTNGNGTLQTTSNPLKPIYIPVSTDFNSASGSKEITFTLTAISNNGCTDATDNVVVTAIAKPIVNAGNDIFDICEQTSIVLSNAVASNYSSISWSTSGNGTFDYSSSTINPTYILGSDDTTSVTLTLSALPNTNCTQTPVSDSMVINLNQNSSLTLDTSEVTMCGETFTLPDLITLNNAKSILWTNVTGASGAIGALTNATTETPTFTPSAAEIANGFVLLKVTTQPEDGCSNIVSETVKVILQPKADVEAGDDLSFCAGEEIIINNNNASVLHSSVYRWSHNGKGKIDPSTINSLNPRYIPSSNESGTIEFTLTANNESPCLGSVSDNVEITIKPQPTITLGPDFSTCEGTTINILNAEATNVDVISWSSSQNNDGTSAASYVSGSFNDPNTINPTYTPSQDDIDLGYVYLNVIASNSACGTTVSEVLKVTISEGVGVFAGANSAICENESYKLDGATSNTTDVIWSAAQNSNGVSLSTYQPGTFSNETSINPKYTPSIDDIARGFVYLTIKGTGATTCSTKTHTLKLTIIKNPTVTASDIEMCVINTTGIALNGSGTNYKNLSWSIVSGPGKIIAGKYYSDLTSDITTNQIARLRLVATPLSDCGTNAVQEISVNIQPLPTVDAGDDGAACYIPGQSIAPFTISNTKVLNASAFNWSTNGADSGNFTTGSTVVYESYSDECVKEVLTLTATGEGACSAETVSDSVIFTVNCAVPTLGSITGDATVCQETSGVSYSVPFNPNVNTYNWQVPTGATIVSGEGTNAITVNYGNAAISGTVSVNGVSGCGSSATESLVVTVNDVPTAAVVSGAQKVCVGTTETYTASTIDNAISYKWTLPDGSTTETTTNTLSYLFSTSAVSGNITVTGRNSCGLGVTSPPLAINVSSPSILTSTKTPTAICGDETFTYSPTATILGSSFSWKRAAITGIANAASSGVGIIDEVLTNISSSTIPVQYEITTTSPSGCESTEIVTVNVYAVPRLTSANSSVAICSGDEFIYDPTASETGVINWSRASVAGIDEAGSSGTNLIKETLTNTTNSPVIVTYSLTLPKNSNGCSGNPISFDVIVNPTPKVTPVVSQNYCAGENVNVSFSSPNLGGNLKYRWTNNNTTIGLAANGISTNLSFIASNSTNNSQVATIEVTPIFENGGVSCEGLKESFTITVNPKGQVAPIISQIVCDGDVTSPIDFTTSGLGSNTTYKWQNSNTSIGLSASGEGNIPAFTALNNGTTKEVATIIVTPYFDDNGILCAGEDKTFTITVNPEAKVTNPGSLVTCNGANFEYTFSSPISTGTVTYTWENNNTAIGLNSSGTQSKLEFAAVNNSLFPITAEIKVTPTYSNGGVSCVGNQEVFTITVNPSADVNNPSDKVVCSNSFTAPIVFTSTNNAGATTYKWINSDSSIGLPTSGVGNINPFLATNTTNSPKTATIRVTPFYNNGGASCEGPSKEFTITVNPSASLNQPVSQTVCNGEPFNFTTFTTDNLGGNTTYTWTNSNISIGLPSSGIGNISSFTAINNTATPQIATIEVTPTYTSNGVTCSGLVKTFTLTVNPSAKVIPPASKAVCNNEEVSKIIFNSPNTLGTTSYSWTNNNTSIGLGANGIGNIPAFTAVNNGLSPITATITVTPTFTYNGVTCVGTSEDFTITVNPSADIVQPADLAVCNGQVVSSVSFNSNNSGGLVTYVWENDNPSIGLAVSDSGNLPSFTAINNGVTPEIATIKVTALYENSGKVCSTAKSFKITVNSSPSATVTGLNNYSVCQNETAPVITFLGSDGVAPYTFEYQINGGAIQQVSSIGTSNFATVVIPTANFGTKEITLLTVKDASNTACSSTNITLPNKAFVEIEQKGAILPQDASTINQILCEQTPLNPIVFSIEGAAKSAFVTGLPSGITANYNDASKTLTISGQPRSTGVFNYTVHTAGSINGCDSTFEGSIEVKSDDVITELTPEVINQDLCACETITPISFNLGGGATGGDVTFTSNIPSGIVWSIDSNILTISGSSCDEGTFNYTVNSYGICEGTSVEGTLKISKTSEVSLATANANIEVCEGSAIATPIKFETSSSTDTLVISPSTPNGITFNPTTGILSGTPTEAGVYNYTVTTSSGCSNALSGTVTVNSAQELTYISGNLDQISCLNSPLDAISYAASNSVTDVSIVPSLPEGIDYTLNAGILTISGTPTSATSIPQNYTITTVGTCGTSVVENFKLEVRKEATITVLSDAETIEQSICQSTEITPIKFTIGGSATGIEVLNLPDNLTVTLDSATGVYTIEGAPIGFGTFNFSVTTTGCAVTQLFAVTNINSNVSIDLTSAPETDNQQLCQTNFNVPITPIVYNVVGATDVQVSDLPAGISSVFDASSGELTISGIPTSSGIFNYAISTSPCSVIKTGILKIGTPISVTNEQVTQLSCFNSNDGAISVTLNGGVQSDSGLYAIKWSGPNGFMENKTTISGLLPGTYTLSGTDAIGCEIPIKTYVIEEVSPVKVSLLSSTNQSCNGTLGCANFDFSGGSGIYEGFKLQFLNPVTENLENVSVANNNYFNVCNLKAGAYYMTATDSKGCSSEPFSFTINDFSSLSISSVDLDEDLCAGNPGNIRVQVASLDPSLSFYYNDVLVVSEFIGNKTYKLSINNPTSPTAELKVKNDQDCWVTETINTTITDPTFEYTSLGLESYGSVDVNETVTFTNGVDLEDIPRDYKYIVWDFGDNTPFKVFFNPEDLIPNSQGNSFKTVFHTYKIDGIYNVSLTVYNSAGCSKTVSELISVGRGASIMPPNAFSPNNDRINDVFRPLLVGVSTVSMYIYDNWGNVVYEVSSEVESLPEDWGWNGIQKGQDVPVKGTYRYFIKATSIRGEKLEKTGQLLLIN